MKLLRRLSVCALAVFALGSSAMTSDASGVFVSAHRGVFRDPVIPENTMTAFRYAHSRGAEAIEFDVRWTKDQRKYILHDATLGRTTNGTGRLEDHSAKYIRGLKVDGGERIPSFREVTQYAKNVGMQINPEVRPVTGKPFTDAQAKSYVSIIYMFNMQNKTVVSSVDPSMLSRIKKYDTKKAMRYSLIQIPGMPLHSPDVVSRMGTVYMPCYTDLTPSYVRALHDRGVKIWAWPIRNSADRSAALALRVDVLVQDRP